jgi:hypothetical protein
MGLPPPCPPLPLCVFLHRVGQRWAHIPKKRGGAPDVLELHGWERSDEVVMVVVG